METILYLWRFESFRRMYADTRHLTGDLEISPSRVCGIPRKDLEVSVSGTRNSCSVEVLVDVSFEEEVQRSVASSWMCVVERVFVVIE